MKKIYISGKITDNPNYKAGFQEAENERRRDFESKMPEL